VTISDVVPATAALTGLDFALEAGLGSGGQPDFVELLDEAFATMAV
jgi:hypothetical protein